MILIVALTVLCSIATACTDPNCINCLTDPTNCKTCAPGYRASLGKCDPCDDPHCCNCNESENYCPSCLDGYRSTEGRCEICQQPHCAKCPLSPSTCTSCMNGYRLTINGCAAKNILQLKLWFHDVQKYIIYCKAFLSWTVDQKINRVDEVSEVNHSEHSGQRSKLQVLQCQIPSSSTLLLFEQPLHEYALL
jgi:hypothetical protein